MKNKISPATRWFGLLYGFIFLTFIGNISLIYVLQSNQKTDASTIDMAGRNRMLSQKIAFLSLQIAAGENVSTELRDAINLHDISFYTLKNGDIASDLSVPPKSLLSLFTSVEESWIPFRDSAKIIAEQSTLGTIAENPNSKNAINYIKEHAVEVLEQNQKLVDAYVNENTNKQRRLLYVFLFLIIIDILIVFVAYLLSRKLTRLLREEVSIKEKSLEKLSGTTKSLDIKTETLENQRIAMLNVMEDLQGEKARTEAILAGVGEGLYVTDADQKIIYANNAFKQMLGYSEEELKGKVLSEAITLVNKENKNIKKADRPISQAIKTRKLIEVSSIESLSYKKKDGSLLAVSMTVSPIMVNDQFIGIVEIFRDATQEREVDKTKSEFVSLASHQLKTPLTSINWYTEILMDKKTGKLSKEQESYLSEIHDASNRMSELVNSLLNVSRLELGTFAIESVPTDFKKIITDVIKDQEAGFTSKNQKFSFKSDTDIPIIKLDGKLTHIIIQNLLSNASKYSPEGSEIELQIEKTDASIRVSCIDHGYGIPENQQKFIFKKLFRADNIRKLDVEGTGLGLYIIKSIAEASGCTISFKSKEGEGTTFYFEIPLSGMKSKDGPRKLSQDTK